MSIRLSPFWFYRIEGDSMRPAYLPGDTVLGLCWFLPQEGQVVVARVDHRLIIKRVLRLEAGQAWLEGDNSAVSTDSRHFGPIKLSQLEAVILAKLPSQE